MKQATDELDTGRCAVFNVITKVDERYAALMSEFAKNHKEKVKDKEERRAVAEQIKKEDTLDGLLPVYYCGAGWASPDHQEDEWNPDSPLIKLLRGDLREFFNLQTKEELR